MVISHWNRFFTKPVNLNYSTTNLNKHSERSSHGSRPGYFSFYMESIAFHNKGHP